jgi:hypothetical protein
MESPVREAAAPVKMASVEFLEQQAERLDANPVSRSSAKL